MRQIMKKNVKKKNKLIHIRLPENIHKKVRVKCAYDDISMQDYIKNLISENVAEYEIKNPKKKKASKK